MLRLLVGVLVIANLAFWAWTQPAIVQALGLPSSSEREPQRLALQQQAQAIRVLPASSPAASAPDPGAGNSLGAPASGPDALAASAGADGASAFDPGLQACLETPALSPAQVPQAVRALQQAGVAPGGWVEMRRDVPGEWLLYMGRFADREQLQRKASELSALALRYEEILSGELAPGLQLGRFDAAAPAQAPPGPIAGPRRAHRQGVDHPGPRPGAAAARRPPDAGPDGPAADAGRFRPRRGRNPLAGLRALRLQRAGLRRCNA